MKKFFLFSLLIFIASFAFAGNGLLMSSIQNSSHDELRRMASAYSIDADVGDDELRSILIEYFDLSEDFSFEDAHESASSIKIEHADKMTAIGDVVIIEGNVVMSLNDEGTSRSVTASRVVVDMNQRMLEASGNVSLLDENQGKTFFGQVVLLDWNDLDVTVFDGLSSSVRNNAEGGSVELYATGDRISYSGSNGTVFFSDGLVSTTSDEPYWSISAGKFSIMGSDLFIDNAVLKLGRVPVLYFPLFFYPGTTLAFNPAIGLSSSRGAFINTTFEVYGKYPGIGRKASSSDDSDVSASVFALMNGNGNGETIRDGLYYTSVDDVEMSELEKWARSTNSYLAVFADAYEKTGLVLGYDMLDNFGKGKLIFSSIGAVNYKVKSSGNTLRYAFDMNIKAKVDRFTFNLSAPVLSDPTARVDLLNRNTVFGIDSVFGKDQDFPKTYSSQNEYSWKADASGSWSGNGYSFSIESMKAQVDYKLTDVDNDGVYSSQIVSASFPYIGISSSGTFFEKKGKSSTVSVPDYTNDLAIQFASEQSSIVNDGQSVSKDSIFGLKTYDGPEVGLESRTSTSGSFKTGYTFRHTLDSRFLENLRRDDFYTKLSGTLFVTSALPDKWFSVDETVKPSFSFSQDYVGESSSDDVTDFSLKSTFIAKSEKLGLTYRLSNDIYDFHKKKGQSSESLSESLLDWDEKHVTENSLEFRKTINGFTFSLKGTFKPVKESLKPSVSFSKNGYSASADISFERPDEVFEKVKGNMNIGYSSTSFSFLVNNSYDFRVSETDALAGYTIVQSASGKLFEGSLSISESFTMKKLIPDSLTISAAHSLTLDKVTSKSSVSFSLKGEEFKADILKLAVDLSLKPIYGWRNRIGFDSSLSCSFMYDFENPYSASLTSTFRFGFSIAEFTDISFSVGSSNKSFFMYYGDDGRFSLDEMFRDLARSFDFFGNGRRNTSFNMSSYSFELVHYMKDWTLTVKSAGNVKTSGGRLTWIPEMTISVQWIAIPELLTENTWKREGERWI